MSGSRTPWRLVLAAVTLIAGLGAAWAFLDSGGMPSKKNFLTIARPAVVESFEIKDVSGKVLWRISTTKPEPLRRLEYGRVPSGYVQETPVDGLSPRALRSGELLNAKTVTPERIFEHQGEAVGTDGFLGGGWESTPRRSSGAPRS